MPRRPKSEPTTATAVTAPSAPAWVSEITKGVSGLPSVMEVWYVPLEHGAPSIYLVGPRCMGSKFAAALRALGDGLPASPVHALMWGTTPPVHAPTAFKVWSRPAA